MIALIEANWPLFLLALVIGIAVAWFIFRATRRTRVEPIAGDVLDDGAAPAARNQALIDAPPVSASPVAAPAASNAATTSSDDLARIKGVGPKLRTMLTEQGVTQIAQIAEWTDADIDRIDALLGKFSGRIRRDDWVTQAKLLGGGDMDVYKAKFGNIE